MNIVPATVIKIYYGLDSGDQIGMHRGRVNEVAVRIQKRASVGVGHELGRIIILPQKVQILITPYERIIIIIRILHGIRNRDVGAAVE
jgi:hypothetical protein